VKKKNNGAENDDRGIHVFSLVMDCQAGEAMAGGGNAMGRKKGVQVYEKKKSLGGGKKPNLQECDRNHHGFRRQIVGQGTS